MDELLYIAHDVLENKHWWFIARRKIIHFMLTLFLDQSQKNRRILDIGCGFGSMLVMLKEFGDPIGADMSIEAVKRARQKTGLTIIHGVLPEEIPLREKSFDVITAFDILEHIKDDTLAFRSVHRLLKPDGLFVLTVPAFKFLWSMHDDLNHHKRRYMRNDLEKKLCISDFSIIKASYFNSLLFPIIVFARMIRNIFGTRFTRSDLKMPPPIINSLLKHVLAIERFGLRFFSYPIGVSLIAIAKKNNKDSHVGE